MDEDTGYHDLEIGPLLRRLRGDTSLREVRRLTGISNSYLSEIEKGDRRPGTNLLKRLAVLYSVDVHDLMKRAGYLDNEGDEPPTDEPAGDRAGLPVRPGRPPVPLRHQALRPPRPGRQALHRRDVRALQREEATGMTNTLDDFCRSLMDNLDEASCPETIDPGAHGGRVRALLRPLGPPQDGGDDGDAVPRGNRRGVGGVAPARRNEGRPLQRPGWRLRHPLPGRPVGGGQGAHGAPRGLRDHPRDPLRPSLRLSAAQDGVQGGRPVRGGGPDAAGIVLPVRRGVRLRRAGFAETVPAAPTPR